MARTTRTTRTLLPLAALATAVGLGACTGQEQPVAPTGEASTEAPARVTNRRRGWRVVKPTPSGTISADTVSSSPVVGSVVAARRRAVRRDW